MPLGRPVDLYYYERCLPVIGAAIDERLGQADAEALLAAAVAPDAVDLQRPRASEVSAVAREESSR